jgi:DNA polymerase-1
MTEASPKFPSGQPSFNEEWLKTNNVGRDIIAVRKWSHLINSFIQPLKERHIQNGRVHPNYHQMRGDQFGTCTGRLSCSEPNLQQIPKRDKEMSKLFRQVFIADEGMEWLEADLSQAEPRLLAHYSGCKALIDGYTSIPEIDSHTAVTNAILAIGVQVTRDDGKRCNQALITGAGKNKIISMLGDKGEQIYNAYFAAMPEIRDFQQKASKRFEQRGYVISLLGMKCRLEIKGKGYLAMNRLLQTGNANILKQAMVRIDKMFEDGGDKCQLLCNVHDSISIQGKPEDRETLMDALVLFTDYGPERKVKLRINMKADYGVGINWGQATFPSEKLTVG